MFDVPEKIVPREQVADFIDRHRHWLHQFPGFQIHLGSLEAHLTYSFTDEGSLLSAPRSIFPSSLKKRSIWMNGFISGARVFT